MNFKSARLIGFLLAAACAGPAFAGIVSVEGDPSGKTVRVEAQDANIDEVLAKLGETEGFTVKRLKEDDKSNVISGRFEGSVYHVLLRILDHENHLIEHSPTTKGGISKIVLYGSSRNLPPRQEIAEERAPQPQQAGLVSPQPLPKQVAITPPPATHQGQKIVGVQRYEPQPKNHVNQANMQAKAAPQNQQNKVYRPAGLTRRVN